MLRKKFNKREADIFVKAKALRWKNRRGLAWAAMAGIFMVMIWALFKVPETRLSILSEIIIWFFMIMGSIVGAYMGFSTFDDKWQNDYKEAQEIVKSDLEAEDHNNNE